MLGQFITMVANVGVHADQLLQNDDGRGRQCRRFSDVSAKRAVPCKISADPHRIRGDHLSASVHPADPRAAIAEKSARGSIVQEIQRRLRTVAGNENVGIAPGVLEAIRRMNAEPAVGQDWAGLVPRQLNVLAGQEAPGLQGTDQVEECHAWIDEGQ